METAPTYTAFAGNRLLVSDVLKTMILRTKDYLDRDGGEPVLIFEDRTGKQIDFDFRGTPDDVLARLATHPLFASAAPATPRPGPGRPKLGTVCREISLLPRHWEWLDRQSGSASGTLRRLVDEARKREPDAEVTRAARDAAGKFMWAIAGNLPNFEEASRALYAGDTSRLHDLALNWPPDIRAHLDRLLAAAERPVSDSTPRL